MWGIKLLSFSLDIQSSKFLYHVQILRSSNRWDYGNKTF